MLFSQFNLLWTGNSTSETFYFCWMVPRLTVSRSVATDNDFFLFYHEHLMEMHFRPDDPNLNKRRHRKEKKDVGTSKSSASALVLLLLLSVASFYHHFVCHRNNWTLNWSLSSHNVAKQWDATWSFSIFFFRQKYYTFQFEKVHAVCAKCFRNKLSRWWRRQVLSCERISYTLPVIRCVYFHKCTCSNRINGNMTVPYTRLDVRTDRILLKSSNEISLSFLSCYCFFLSLTLKKYVIRVKVQCAKRILCGPRKQRAPINFTCCSFKHSEWLHIYILSAK